jgi:hypothetical protein
LHLSLPAYTRRWAIYVVTCCNVPLLAVGPQGNIAADAPIEAIYPTAAAAAVEIPEPARTYLQEALETPHAPNSAAMAAGSAVDAMLKSRGLTKGTVNERIDEAVRQQILTPEMAEWAHRVRFVSNQPRHADTENSLVTPPQAQHSVEFAEALGQFLFVLPSRVKKGIEAAKKADAGPDDAAAGECGT